MPASRYVYVIDGQAEGVILWDGAGDLELPEGQQLVPEADWTGPTSPPDPPDVVVENALRGRADQAIDLMQAHIDRGTFTAAQMTNAMLLVLRVCIALARLVLGRLDSAGS